MGQLASLGQPNAFLAQVRLAVPHDLQKALSRSAGVLGATLSFYTAIGCHWLSSLRESQSSLADIFCQNDSVALSYE
jgi:hypothetical protein